MRRTTGFPTERGITHKKMGVIKRVRIFEQIAVLPIRIYSLGRRFANGSNQLCATVLFTTQGGVEGCQFPCLPAVVTGEYGDHLACSGNTAGMEDSRRKPGVVPIEGLLPRTIGQHLEQPLRIYLTAVVVIPTGIQHPPVFCDGGIVVMYLIESQPTQKPAVSGTGIEIRHFRPPAVYNLNAAC